MPAFEAAVGLGFEYIETDIHATADGFLAACHDKSLARTVGEDQRIGDLSRAELSRIRLAGGERIPLLADLLDAFPETRINIDPKHDAAVEPLLSLLRERRLWERVCVGSFSSRRLRYLRRAAGDRLCTSAGPREIIRLSLTARGLPVGRLQADCVQVPPYRYRMRVVDAALVSAAHKQGLPVHVWTVNRQQDMRDLLDLGVDGIMTDEAAMAMDLFKKHYW